MGPDQTGEGVLVQPDIAQVKSSPAESRSAVTSPEITSLADARVNEYMPVVNEVMSLPEADPNREAKLLQLMDQLEAARAKGEIEASVIGEGRDRTMIFRQPSRTIVREPARLPLRPSDAVGLQVGEMLTTRDIYLAVNRTRFTGLAVTVNQEVQVQPDAEMFTREDSFYSGSYGEEHFQKQQGRWLGDCKEYAGRTGLQNSARVNRLMAQENYQSQPDSRDRNKYPMNGVWDTPQMNDQYRADSEAWADSDSVRPDGQWAGYIQLDETYLDPITRMPGEWGTWFDVGVGPASFVAKRPETVERVLRANIKEPPKPQSPQPLPPPAV